MAVVKLTEGTTLTVPMAMDKLVKLIDNARHGRRCALITAGNREVMLNPDHVVYIDEES